MICRPTLHVPSTMNVRLRSVAAALVCAASLLAAGCGRHAEHPAPASAPSLRVQVATPEKSLVLTMPSAENPPDSHPNITFTGPEDADYLKLLVWIREGAKNN